MSLRIIEYCPGTLTKGYKAYSRTCLRRMFDGRKVNHILPYESPASNGKNTDDVKTEVTMENLSLLL
jgi:serine/threonine-protein kinase HipA